MAKTLLAKELWWLPGDEIARVYLTTGAWYPIDKGRSRKKDDAFYGVEFSCGHTGKITHGQLRRREFSKNPVGACRKCVGKSRKKTREEKRNWQPKQPLPLAMWVPPPSVLTQGHWYTWERPGA